MRLDFLSVAYEALTNDPLTFLALLALGVALFYVHSQMTPGEAFSYVLASMDANDRLAVINADSALGALVTNWDHPPIDAINSIWTAP